MKKIIVIAFLLFMVAPPVRADASTVEERVSVTFIANPNLSQLSPAPGIPPNGNPVQVTISKGSLPKTGEKQSSLIPLGMFAMIIATLLLFQKKKGII